MSAREMIHVRGTVEEVLPSRMYRVRLTTGDVVLTTIAGRARRGLRVLRGDPVEIEMSPYNLNRGRITGRADDKTHTGGET